MIQRLLMLFLCAFNIHHDPKCILSSRIHFGEPLPVMIRNGKLLEPTDNYGNVELVHGDAITLSCEGSGVIAHPQAIREVATATITCEAGDSFRNNEWLSSLAQFTSFRCRLPSNHRSQRTNRTCFENNPIVEVGYIVENQFYPSYESCFNEQNLNVIYSKYTQKPYNAIYQTKVDRPYFISDGNFRSIPVESLFSPLGLKAAVARLVGKSIIDNYFTNYEFLSRGHLAAKTDFVFAFGERATFHYVNCAPQWVGFNGGNWNSLEVDLRNHIHVAGYDTIMYTGTYGISQLNNEYGRRVDLFLYTDENNNPVIPVPLYYYKVVYEPQSQRGVAFVGINNPYYTPDEARELFFCKDVCRGDRRFSWLTWRPDDPHKGYTFCCTVPDFRETVRHLPQFEVGSLLT